MWCRIRFLRRSCGASLPSASGCSASRCGSSCSRLLRDGEATRQGAAGGDRCLTAERLQASRGASACRRSSTAARRATSPSTRSPTRLFSALRAGLRRSAPAARRARAACSRGALRWPVRPADRWPLERVLFALAGSMTLGSVALAAVVSPWFLLLTAFVGVNQWLYVVVGACPASLVAEASVGLSSAVYPEPETADDVGRARRQTGPLYGDAFPHCSASPGRRCGGPRVLRASASSRPSRAPVGRRPARNPCRRGTSSTGTSAASPAMG